MSANTRQHFPIRSIDYDSFFAGRIRDERQVLMGMLYPHLVACFFDGVGRFLSVDTRDASIPKMDDPQFDDLMLSRRARWQEENGFRPTTSHIRRFHDPITGTALFDRPRSYEALLRPASQTRSSARS